MIKSITIIDYGINNLKSVKKAFEKLGKNVEITNSPDAVLKAEAVIMPGTGSFNSGMKSLNERGLIDCILRKAAEDVPFLCICLGMQMLFTESVEFGVHRGLNLISGKVKPIKSSNSCDQGSVRIPHMGWNGILNPESAIISWKETVLRNVSYGSDVYFVHSYMAVPDNTEQLISISDYGPFTITSAFQKGRITGLQFHPEKSGEIGLEILNTFCAMHSI